jgi:magnesium-transporting ATPase (P-type)
MALSLTATIFLLRVSITLKPQDIVTLSTAQWGFHKGVKNNLVKQTVDAWVGFIFLVLAVSVQMVTMLMPTAYLDWRSIGPCGIGIFVLLLALFCLIAFLGTSLGHRVLQKRINQLLSEPREDEPSPQLKVKDNESAEENTETVKALLEIAQTVLADEKQRLQSLRNNAYFHIVAIGVILTVAVTLVSDAFERLRCAWLFSALSCILLLLAILFFVFGLMLSKWPRIEPGELTAKETLRENPDNIRRIWLLNCREFLDEYGKELSKIVWKIRCGQVLFWVATVSLLIAIIYWVRG